jgi:hypothetical protein
MNRFHTCTSTVLFPFCRRDPKSLVKPLKKTEVPDASLPEYADAIKKHTPTASRHLYLIRHGQYNLKAEQDSGRDLTQLGSSIINAYPLILLEETSLYRP